MSRRAQPRQGRAHLRRTARGAGRAAARRPATRRCDRDDGRRVHRRRRTRSAGAVGRGGGRMRMHAASDMPSGGGAPGGCAAPLPIPAAYVARVRLDEPMAAHCSWHAGGAAQAYFNPRDVEELAGFLRALPPSVPVYWVGLGTNLLVREGGIRGVVIATAGAFTRIERRSASTVYCEASVPCARIARNCALWSLPQAEFFAGIPGSFGGALAMNAGAFGDETWRHVLSVQTIDRAGEHRGYSRADYEVGYRSVALRAAAATPVWFLAAELQFDPQALVGGTTSGSSGDGTIAALMQRRRETQPLGA